MTDRSTFPLNLWKLSDSGELTLVLTVEPMYLYQSTGTFNLVLTSENLDDIHQAFDGMDPDEQDDYADLDAILEAEFGST